MRRPQNPAPVIPNDRLEHDRIMLETNLRHSETAIHLSSATESEAEDNLESLEYPRHNPGPASFNELPSLDYRVRDHLADEDTPGQGWSYRTGDDYDEGINPYGGESLSTLAHHASAVTLGAGLGGRGTRRDTSMSGAEYDPDRPIHEIIAGVTSKLSVFDADHSKRQTLENITNDPYMVEDTAELDQILETGAQPYLQRSVRVASPVTSGSSSHSDLDQPTLKGRPKLSDALRNAALSPKRPRSPQITRPFSPSPKQLTPSPLFQSAQHPATAHVATPHPAQRSSVHPSKLQPPKPNPKVTLNPPTPSSASASSKSSKFTHIAKGLAKEIEYEKGQLNMKQPTKRPESLRPASIPYGESTSAPVPTNQTHTLQTSARDKSRIQLPDVTGLTNAIESPAKVAAKYYAYRTEGKLRETETRLLHTLNNVQKRIQQLEEENGISRRRVRELEMELEDCKREVVRERTRLIEQEELLKQRMVRTVKGKERARDPLNDDSSRFHERYKEAVEEKKALEALITSLRTHLTRLTSELSSHRELLAELRTLRDADSATLRGKGAEITHLKNEVERLAGEVEVLRGVVEEGLRERRAAKEASLQSAHRDEIRHHEFTEEEEEEEEEEQIETEPEDAGVLYANASMRNRTVRTDCATQGSPINHDDGRATRFMDSINYERISAEIEDRRSNHSGSVDISQFPRIRSPAQPPSPKSRRYNQTMSVVDESAVGLDVSALGRKASSPDSISDPEEGDAFGVSNPGEPGPSTRPRTIHGSEEEHDHELHTRRRVPADVVDEVPFPKIRGQRLERLFFAAPEHDARTCPTCNRCGRRRLEELPLTSAWRNQRISGTQSRHGSDEDEGFVEGSDNLDQRQKRYPRDQGHIRSSSRGQRRERSLRDINEVPSVAKQEGLPPQTIVARIIRELEDDFTHYKSVYIELADEYKEMDAASNVAQRNTLAKHLREVVDILEQKGDQIASLYDQLSFKNKSAGGRDIGVRTR